MVDLPSLKHAWLLTLTPFNYAHQPIFLLSKATKLAKDCAEHYSPTIPQGVSFNRFENHLKNVDCV